jgi:hypothetical protein
MKIYRGLGDVVVTYPEQDNVTRLSLPAVWDFTKYCLSVKPRGGFADARHFELCRLQRWLDQVVIVDYLADIDAFRYRRYGPGLVRLTGYDMTGRFVSDFDSEVGRFFERLYRKAVDEKIIIRSEHARVHALVDCDWHRVLCPFRDGEKVGVVTCNFPILK